MAGGMTGGGWGRRGLGIPLAERVRAGAGSSAPSPVRHCWVTEVDGGPRRPGLLVEWRQGAEGWQGRVVHSAQLRDDGEWSLVEEWLPADRLTPL